MLWSRTQFSTQFQENGSWESKSTHKPFVIMGQKTLVVVEHPLQQACHLRNLSKVIKLPLCNSTSLLAKTITTISYPGCNFKDVWQVNTIYAHNDHIECDDCARSVPGFISGQWYFTQSMCKCICIRRGDCGRQMRVCGWKLQRLTEIQINNYIKTEIKCAFQMSLILNLWHVLKSTRVYGELCFTTRANTKQNTAGLKFMFTCIYN